MLKKLSYAFMVLAVLLTVSHNITAHDHHVVREIEHDEHDDDGDDDHSAHTFFSYGHLEDSFVNSKVDVSVDHAAPVFVLSDLISPDLKLKEAAIDNFVLPEDAPPVMRGHFPSLPLRAPPVS